MSYSGSVWKGKQVCYGLNQRTAFLVRSSLEGV